MLHSSLLPARQAMGLLFILFLFFFCQSAPNKALKKSKADDWTTATLGSVWTPGFLSLVSTLVEKKILELVHWELDFLVLLVELEIQTRSESRVISGSGLGLSLYLLSYVEMCRKNALVPHCWHLLFKGVCSCRNLPPGVSWKTRYCWKRRTFGFGRSIINAHKLFCCWEGQGNTWLKEGLVYSLLWNCWSLLRESYWLHCGFSWQGIEG